MLYNKQVYILIYFKLFIATLVLKYLTKLRYSVKIVWRLNIFLPLLNKSKKQLLFKNYCIYKKL